ncbi:Phenylacetic acid catabolic protein [Hyphomicrobium sp. MC1]|uniref:Phenylacetic acid catabolic protein n=1 Tax=Hyphomicrobium sp. (strain MC1) TaxID=717785 RepID=UPI000213E90D|nr:Phenylacetic acid catabolic protein [Hyphomicrobium sp. MC1]CCB66569.1 conserved protein of unknown function [Hyphomicrobium sp. MC1]
MNAIIEESTTADPNYISDLLAVGDSKHALSAWCFTTVFNGRSVADFATLLALGGTSLGHARVLFQYLVNYGFDYDHLERGRRAEDIHAMAVLDRPPQSWPDLLAAIFAAEAAIKALTTGFLDGSDRQGGLLLKKIHQEQYFHQLYVKGWAEAFEAEEQAEFVSCLGARAALANEWIGPAEQDDSTHVSGLRKTSNKEVHALFNKELNGIYQLLEVAIELPKRKISDAWDRRRRRAGAIPDGLFQHMRVGEQ